MAETRAVDRAAMVNDVRLQGLPDAVREKFLLEHPGADVTTVQPLRSHGPPLYRIGYILNGDPGEAMYFYDGTRHYRRGEARPVR